MFPLDDFHCVQCLPQRHAPPSVPPQAPICLPPPPPKPVSAPLPRTRLQGTALGSAASFRRAGVPPVAVCAAKRRGTASSAAATGASPRLSSKTANLPAAVSALSMKCHDISAIIRVVACDFTSLLTSPKLAAPLGPGNIIASHRKQHAAIQDVFGNVNIGPCLIIGVFHHSREPTRRVGHQREWLQATHGPEEFETSHLSLLCLPLSHSWQEAHSWSAR